MRRSERHLGLRLMRQDNQPLHGAFGEFVTDLCCRLKWRKDCCFPVKEFSSWRQLACVDIQHRAESRNCRRQEENNCIKYCQTFLDFILSMIVLHLLFLVTFDWYDETVMSLFCLVCESLYNLRFLFYCAATRLVPNVLITVTTQRCIAVEMQCVFCSLTLWSSKQEVVITLFVLLISRTTIRDLPWLLWGGKKERKKKNKSITCFSVFKFFFSINQITSSLFCSGL